MQFKGQNSSISRIQFCINTQYSTIWPIGRNIWCYQSGSKWTWERWQWRSTPHSPKLQYYWNLTIRLFSVISRTLVGGGLTALQRSSWYILQPQPPGQKPFRLQKGIQCRSFRWFKFGFSFSLTGCLTKTKEPCTSSTLSYLSFFLSFSYTHTHHIYV